VITIDRSPLGKGGNQTYAATFRPFLLLNLGQPSRV
jgi:hypothetical protein